MEGVKSAMTSEGRVGDASPLKIILASGSVERFAPLASGLWTAAEVEIYQASSSPEVMEMLAEKSVELVIIDETLRDMSGLELTRMVARQHPFVNCMLVSSLPDDAFHEETEGLGVLMQISSPPEMGIALKILEHLSAIKASQFVE